MKTYREKQTTKQTLISITCDKCHLTFTDTLDLQEFHSFDFVGGYASQWGDGNNITGDICGACFHILMKEYLVVEIGEAEASTTLMEMYKNIETDMSWMDFYTWQTWSERT